MGDYGWGKNGMRNFVGALLVMGGLTGAVSVAGINAITHAVRGQRYSKQIVEQARIEGRAEGKTELEKKLYDSLLPVNITESERTDRELFTEKAINHRRLTATTASGIQYIYIQTEEGNKFTKAYTAFPMSCFTNNPLEAIQ